MKRKNSYQTPLVEVLQVTNETILTNSLDTEKDYGDIWI